MKPTRRILTTAVLTQTVAPMVLVSATPKHFQAPPWLGICGAALMMAGLVIGFSGIALLMADDRYVAVVEGGLLVHLGAEEAFFAWDTLGVIRCEEDTLVLSVRAAGTDRAGEPRRSMPTPEMLRFRFSRERLEEIVARLEDWRRKASWNLAPLPPP